MLVEVVDALSCIEFPLAVFHDVENEDPFFSELFAATAQDVLLEFLFADLDLNFELKFVLVTGRYAHSLTNLNFSLMQVDGCLVLDPENDEILLKYTEEHLLERSLEEECSLLLRNRDAILDGLHISYAHSTDIQDTLVMDLGGQSFLDVFRVLPRLHELVNDVRDAGLLSLVDHDYEAQKLWLLLRSLLILGSL